MRVIIFAYQSWGHRTLAALREAEHEVSLVVTHPPSDHAYERIGSDSVEELAIQHGIPVLLRSQPGDEELMSRLKEAEPDVIVATNWRTWIPPQVFGLPRYGTLNVHDSLLPAYAGFAPINWALINGEEQVGVTAHMMDADPSMASVHRAWAVSALTAATPPRFPPSSLSLAVVSAVRALRGDPAAVEHDHPVGDRRAAPGWW